MKKVRFAIHQGIRYAFIYFIVLTTINLLCCCGTSTRLGQALAEHSVDYHLLVTLEGNSQLDGSIVVPVYRYQNRYFVRTERVIARSNTPVTIKYSTPSTQSDYEFQRSTSKIEYCEVKVERFSDIDCCILSTVDTCTNVDEEKLIPIGLYQVRSSCIRCDKNGEIQPVIKQYDDRLTLRALYALPSAAVLFVCVDVPLELFNGVYALFRYS